MAERQKINIVLNTSDKHNIKTNLFAHELRKQESMIFSRYILYFKIQIIMKQLEVINFASLTEKSTKT